jgi:predicted transcriptional regulator
MESDDIVAKLERLARRAETSKTYVQEFRMMRAEGVADLIHEAMDEIVDLRAQLFNEQEAQKHGNA